MYFFFFFMHTCIVADEKRSFSFACFQRSSIGARWPASTSNCTLSPAQYKKISGGFPPKHRFDADFERFMFKADRIDLKQGTFSVDRLNGLVHCGFSVRGWIHVKKSEWLQLPGINILKWNCNDKCRQKNDPHLTEFSLFYHKILLPDSCYGILSAYLKACPTAPAGLTPILCFL